MLLMQFLDDFLVSFILIFHHFYDIVSIVNHSVKIVNLSLLGGHV